MRKEWMNSYTKRGGAARRRFCVIFKKPEGGGRKSTPPPGCARVNIPTVIPTNMKNTSIQTQS